MLNKRQAIMWSIADPIPWCIYATLGGDELTDENAMYCQISKFKFEQLDSIDKFTVFVLGC